MGVGRASHLHFWDGTYWNTTPSCTLFHGQEGISATGFLLLINLDQGGTWPHTEEGKLCLYGLDIEVDTEADFLGTLYIGFVSDQGVANARLNVIRSYHFEQGRRTLLSNENFHPFPIICDTTHWAGVWSALAGLKTGTTLATPIPGLSQLVEDGDLVAYWAVTSADKDVEYSVTIRYTGLEEDDLGYIPLA